MRKPDQRCRRVEATGQQHPGGDKKGEPDFRRWHWFRPPRDRRATNTPNLRSRHAMTELLFREDAYLRSCAARVVAVDDRGIRLDRTVFYPAGGGQPGDTGVLRLPNGGEIAIIDTVKGDSADEVIHVLAPDANRPAPGDVVT